MINKSFKLTETLVALSNYEQIAQMKNAHRQILTIAQQQTNARLQPPILKAIIKSEAVMPYAIALAKAQVTQSANYKFLEAWSLGECREPEDMLFLVCAQTGGPENAREMAAAYKSARAAAGDEAPHAAGVAAARAIAMRPAASSAAGERQAGSHDAEEFGLAAEVPGRWHLASVCSCSCQLFMHHG